MKTLTCLFILSLCTIYNPILAQQKSYAEVKKGKRLEPKDKANPDGVVGYDKDFIYTLKSKKNKCWLESYTHQLVFKKSTELNLKYEGKEMLLDQFLQVKENLYVFLVFLNQKQKIKYTFWQKIDKKTLQLTGVPKKISEDPYKTKFFIPNHFMTLSPDSSVIMVRNRIKAEVDHSSEQVKVYDKDMNPIWNNVLTIPFDRNNCEVPSVKIQNDQTVLMTVKKYGYKKYYWHAEKKEINFKFKLFTFTEKGKKSKETELNLPEKHIINLKVGDVVNNAVSCVGFFADKGNKGINGFFSFKQKLNSGEMEALGLKPIGLEFFSMNYSKDYLEKLKEKEQKAIDKAKEKGKEYPKEKIRNFMKYTLDHMAVMPDGSMFVVAENFYDIETRRSGEGGTYSTYRYYYDNLMVIYIDQNGGIQWSKMIPKWQMNWGVQLYTSYGMATYNDAIYLIFNDNPNNGTKLGPNGGARFSQIEEDSNVILYRIDTSGEENKEILYNNKNNKCVTQAEMADQISNNNVILFSGNKKYNLLSKVTLK